MHVAAYNTVQRLPAVRSCACKHSSAFRLESCSRSACRKHHLSFRPVRSLASDHIYAQQAKAMSSSAESTAVVVVDHGSRREASNRMLEDFVNLYRQTSGRQIVEGAHMEIAEPTIADAVRKCASAGATTIVVAPYFLSRGRHIQEDIPALVAAAQEQHPGVKCIVAEPIGLDPLMAQLIETRVQTASTTATAY
ncbi:hypothetical protein WJX79_003694 [Trebouxia sp. C0005]